LALGRGQESTDFSFYENYEHYGFSVRCVRDLYIGTIYVEYSEPTKGNVKWRKGVRSGQLRVDATNPDSILGFSGTEGIDWYNVKST
jgi:hypothetical protein